MARRPRISGYHRKNLGGGNALKAVTRIRRAAAGARNAHLAAPGKAPGPAHWRTHERRQVEKLEALAETAYERMVREDDAA